MHRRHSPVHIGFFPSRDSSSIVPEESLMHNSEPRCQRRKRNWEMTESRLNNVSICWSVETGKKWTGIIKDMWKLVLVSLSHTNDGVGCMHVCVGEHSLHCGLLWWNTTCQLLEVMVALWPALVRPSREHCVTSGSHRVWKGTLIQHYISRDITSMVIALKHGFRSRNFGVKSRRLK